MESHTSVTIQILKEFGKKCLTALGDLAPILLVITLFQLAVLRQPLPQLAEILVGCVMVVMGLMLFVQGLEMGLFPIGDAMAVAFARKGNLVWLLIFAFALGFSTTIAEPALIAVSQKAAQVAAEATLIASDDRSQNTYALGLRITVALSVAMAISLGVLRILKGWPLHYLIIGGYALVVLITFMAPPEIIGIAYDSGGITTSTVTVPLVTALGVGLSTTIRERNPLIDGFGLIALASLLPMIFVMGYGMLFIF